MILDFTYSFSLLRDMQPFSTFTFLQNSVHSLGRIPVSSSLIFSKETPVPSTKNTLDKVFFLISFSQFINTIFSSEKSNEPLWSKSRFSIMASTSFLQSTPTCLNPSTISSLLMLPSKFTSSFLKSVIMSCSLKSILKLI